MKLSSFAPIISKYEYFIFDSDGTLLEMLNPIGDSLKIIDIIRKQNKRIYVYSNNSKKSLEDLVKRYHENRCELLPEKELITSAYVTTIYLKTLPNLKNVYLIGSCAFKKILENSGFQTLHWENDKGTYMTKAIFDKCDTKDVDAVVVGGDNAFNFYKLAYGSLCVQNGAKFIVSDNDPTFKFRGYDFPSSAFASYPIEVVSCVKPTVVGKPSALALDMIMKRDGITEKDKDKIVMIGDSLNTDIMFGINAGIDTVLVLTGVTTETMLADSPVKPTYIIDKLNI